MRKYIFVLILALLLVLSAGCQMQQNRVVVVDEEEIIVTDEMDLIISDYIAKEVAHNSFGGPSFAAQEYYGTEEKSNGELYVYLSTYYMEYSKIGGQLKEESGGITPLVVVLQKANDGKYSVSKHFSPEIGNEYSASVRRLFPQKYHDRILSRDHGAELAPLARQKAEKYYAEQLSQENVSSAIESIRHYYKLGDSNVLHIEELPGNNEMYFVFYEDYGYLFLDGIRADLSTSYGFGSGLQLYTKKGGFVSAFMYDHEIDETRYISYAVAANPEVESVLIKNQPAQLVEEGGIRFWFLFTEATEEDVVALNSEGEEVPLISYEHLEVPESEQKVDVSVTFRGIADNNGMITVFMDRGYRNNTGMALDFFDNIFFRTFPSSGIVASGLDVISISEGIAVDSDGGGNHRISGNVAPYETKSLMFMYQYESHGGTGGRHVGLRYNERIDLYSRNDSTRIRHINASMSLPPGTIRQQNQLNLYKLNEDIGMYETVSAPPYPYQYKFPMELRRNSWFMMDDEYATSTSGKTDFKNVMDVSVALDYTINVNTLPHSLTYLAIALGIAAFFFTFRLYRMVRKS